MRLGCLPNFLTIFHQLHEGQQDQVKQNVSLVGSFPISHGIKQGCVLAPTLFSNFFSIMLHKAKETLPDSIYICFLTCMKTIDELITELLFADDCALLVHT